MRRHCSKYSHVAGHGGMSEPGLWGHKSHIPALTMVVIMSESPIDSLEVGVGSGLL